MGDKSTVVVDHSKESLYPYLGRWRTEIHKIFDPIWQKMNTLGIHQMAKVFNLGFAKGTLLSLYINTILLQKSKEFSEILLMSF